MEGKRDIDGEVDNVGNSGKAFGELDNVENTKQPSVNLDGDEEEPQENQPLLDLDGKESRPGCCPDVNREYLPSKVFFFLYFAANGTLMPYLVLFFKQLRLTSSQVGIVSGLKPFISFFFVPIWGHIADRTNKTRVIYVIAMIAYVSGYFSYSLAPAKHVCMQRSNSTQHKIMYPMSMHSHGRRSLNCSQQQLRIDFIQKIPNSELFKGAGFQNSSSIKIDSSFSREETYHNHSTKNIQRRMMYEYLSEAYDNTWPTEHRYRYPWSSQRKIDSTEDINYQEQDEISVDTKPIFIYLLTVTIVSTLFSCPALTIVDTATIRKLKQKQATHRYGKQRLWGSLGWGISAFGVGAIIALIPLCPGKNDEVNYYPAFYVFAVLLLFALVAGLKLTFSDQAASKSGENVEEVNEVESERESKTWIVMKLMTKPKYLAFIMTAFYIGVAMSIIRTFLLWHLKDIGGTQILFSIVPAINCSAEVFMYFFSSMFIQKVGHIRVLYIALVCYAIRLFYYGLLANPWFALAVEPFSGITTAAAWASMTSYVGLNSPPCIATTMQGILHGVHWGLGHGCGELIGGFMVSWIGAPWTFLLFGFLSLINLLLFVLVNILTENCCPDDHDDSKNALQDYIPVQQAPSCH